MESNFNYEGSQNTKNDDFFLCPVSSLPEREKRRLSRKNKYLRRLIRRQERNEDIIEITDSNDDANSESSSSEAVRYIGSQKSLGDNAFVIGAVPGSLGKSLYHHHHHHHHHNDPTPRFKRKRETDNDFNAEDDYYNSYSKKRTHKKHHHHTHENKPYYHSLNRKDDYYEESSPASFSLDEDMYDELDNLSKGLRHKSDPIGKKSRYDFDSEEDVPIKLSLKKHKYSSKELAKEEKKRLKKKKDNEKNAKLANILHKSEIAAPIDPLSRTPYEDVVSGMLQKMKSGKVGAP